MMFAETFMEYAGRRNYKRKRVYSTRRAKTKRRGRTYLAYGTYNPSWRRNITTEKKFFDFTVSDGVVAAAGGITATINNIAQGTTESTRVGRKIVIHQIYWKMNCFLNDVDAAATPEDGEILRIILYLDKQCNGATATVTGVLETSDDLSFRNLANVGRFDILHDTTVNLNRSGLGSDGAGLVSSNGLAKRLRYSKRCNIPIEFDSTTGAITEITSNNLGVLLISRNGTAGFLSKFRLRFTD